MKITRRGARADNGSSGIGLNIKSVSNEDGSIVLKAYDVDDFVTKAHYNYRIHLSYEEVSEIIRATADFDCGDKSEIGTALEGNLKSLLKLTNACVE